MFDISLYVLILIYNKNNGKFKNNIYLSYKN